MALQIESARAALAALNLRRDELADIELQLFLDALLRYGNCDFRNFNQSVLRRRIADAMRAHEVETISALQDRLLHDDRAFAAFVVAMRGANDTLFRETSFLRAITANVIPLLRTYSFVRIWIPGTSTGADAYSIAALLDDAGMLEKSVIYATCINDVSVAVAKVSGYEHRSESELAALARNAGLSAPVSSYFEMSDGYAHPRDRLRQIVMFARHDPVTDGSINEFHAIVSRGLISLYNGAVQYRLHRLFLDSLMHLGFLALGEHETLEGTVHERAFRQVLQGEQIYRRMR
jgi:chemotaxis protein methyltransferase CheR